MSNDGQDRTGSGGGTDSSNDKRPDDFSRRVADGESVDWDVEEERAQGSEEKRAVRGMRKLADLAAAQGASSGSGTENDRMPHRNLGDFELLREIGRGGMGVVYEARQISLNRRVALKVLPPGLGLTPEAVKRFEREAQAAAKLHHTNIVPVYAIGEADGCHFYAMELIEGQALSEVLRDLTGSGTSAFLDATVTRMTAAGDSPAPDPGVSSPSMGKSGITSRSDASSSSRKWFDAVAKLIAEVADALDYAHGRGVIHRDIKPANLMLSADGRLCITDFGLARVAQEPGMTISGSLMGTPAYMSPEQVASGRMKLDHRTDVYSLGAVLYEMLTHRRPFPGESREEILGGILTKDPRPPRRFNPRIPVDLETICQKAMEKDPDKRYQTAGEFAEDLRRYLAHGLIQARRAGIAKRTWKSIRRHPVASTVTVGVIVVAALAILAGKAWIGMTQESVGRRIAEIRHQVTRGEFREGLAEVEEILAADPVNPDGLLLRARIHLHQDHYVDCLNDARQVLQQIPQSWEAHALVAAAAVLGHLYSVPVDDHLRMVEEAVPDTADAYFLRGFLAQYGWGREQDWGDTQEAIHWLTQALEKDPGHALALETRSDAYTTLKDFPAALADAERLIAALPRNVEGYCQKAWVLRGMRDLDGAMQAANRAIEIAPESYLGYESRSRIHEDTGNRIEQIADLSRVIELNPRSYLDLEERGSAFQEEGRVEDAIRDFERCIELNPDGSGCYTGLFYTHWKNGDREEALRSLDRMEDRAGQYVSVAGKSTVATTRAIYHRIVGEFQQAEEVATRLIELTPHKIDGYEMRLWNRRFMGDKAGVEEDCDLIAAVELGLPHQLLRRGMLLQDACNREDAALVDIDAAIEKAPSWADTYNTRGILHAKNKRYEQGLADLDRALELAPSWLVAQYNRGRVLAAVERYEEALDDYETCVTMGRDDLPLRRSQASALTSLGREEEALDVLQNYVDGHPADSTGWRTYAIGLWGQGRVKEAVEALDHILANSPGDEANKAFRAFYAAFDPDSCEESAQAMEEYASKGIATPDTWSNISYMHTVAYYYTCPEHYDPDIALEHAKKAAEADSRNRTWQLNYAIALYRHGRFQDALAVLEHVFEIARRPNSHALFWMSMAQARLGDLAEAREHYDRAVADKTGSRRPDTAAFRAEAAELLGIEL